MSPSSCQLPVLGIVDIDGSVVENVYHDQKLLSDPDLLDKTLASLPPLPWVLEYDTLRRMTIVKVITGRQARQRQLTKVWFAKNLGIRDLELIMVSFKTKDQYIDDKKRTIRDVVDEYWAVHGKRSPVIFIEDDPIILEFIREEFSLPTVEIVAVDQRGVPHFS